jgi:hypothetical protein
VYAGKVPDHRGLTLTSAISLELRDERLTISRTGTDGLSMKIQAKDCAQGGIFQMEPSRGDGTRTRIVHRLADNAFYFDNPNFRARLGEFLGSECQNAQTGPASAYCVRVTPRVNIASDAAPKLILRDSAQVATRVRQPSCGPDFTTDCITECQAGNSVVGRLEILGFPSPVPPAGRLTARTSTDGLSAPLTAP